jgi:hypothetical protein
MKYKEMLEHAKAKGLASEKTMWDSIDDIEDMLCYMKREHPDKYWRFMRNQHAIMWHDHYSEEFAEYDISKLKWEDTEGNKHEGAYWTKAQVLEASKGLAFPPGTTDCDKWVAFNSMYSDLSTICTDAEIIKIAYTFYFKDFDFDYTTSGKIWKYMANV